MSDILNITLHFSFMREHESTPKPKIQDHMPKLKPLIDSIRFSADDVSTKLSFDDLEFILWHLIESTEISFFSREKFNYSLNHSQFAEGTAFYAMTSSVDVNFEKLSNSKHSKLLKPIYSSADWEKAKKAARRHTKELVTQTMQKTTKKQVLYDRIMELAVLVTHEPVQQAKKTKSTPALQSESTTITSSSTKKKKHFEFDISNLLLEINCPIGYNKSGGGAFQNVNPSKQTRQHPILTWPLSSSRGTVLTIVACQGMKNVAWVFPSPLMVPELTVQTIGLPHHSLFWCFEKRSCFQL